MFQVKFLEDVFTDIQEAKEWYKSQKIGLDEYFAECIEEAILKIILNANN